MRRFLASQGLRGAVADDVVQEVAARALATKLRYDDVDELVRWSCTVAKNLIVDEHRRAARRLPPGSAENLTRAAEDDALGRVALADTLRAIGRLSTRDQSALIAQLRPPVQQLDRRSQVRENVALCRARSRLMRLLAAVAAPVVVRLDRLRKKADVGGLVAAAGLGIVAPLLVTSPLPETPNVPVPAQAEVPPVGGPSVVDRSSTAPEAVRIRSKETTRAAARPANPAPPPERPPKPRALITAPPAGVKTSTPVADAQVTVREKKGDDRLLCIRRIPRVDTLCVG